MQIKVNNRHKKEQKRSYWKDASSRRRLYKANATLTLKHTKLLENNADNKRKQWQSQRPQTITVKLEKRLRVLSNKITNKK